MSGSLEISEWSEEDVLKCAICSREVEDAFLLGCLHSACRLCTEGDKSNGITCPTCNVTTDAATGKTNLLVSSLAQRSRVLKNVFTCTRCIDDKQQDVPAVAWCYTCQESLCIDCQKHLSKVHSPHRVMLLNECTNLSELYRPPARSCPRHDEEITFACFTCKSGRCNNCAHDCYTSRHHVVPHNSPDALKQMTDYSKQISDARLELRSAVKLLHAHLSLPQRIYSSREESLSRIKGEKKTAIDSISDAYETAVESLQDCWDSVLEHSLILREKADRLQARASCTDQYCRLVSNSSDIAALLPQLDDVLSSLRTCLEEVREFKEPADPSNLASFNARLPTDLDDITNGWFGSAKIVRDDVNCTFKVCRAEESTDYYNLKVSTLNELEQLLRCQKEEKEAIQRERQAMVKLQSDIKEKDAQLDAKDKEIQQLQEQHKELQGQLEGQRRTVAQQQSELTKRTHELDAKDKDMKKFQEQYKELQGQLEGQRRTVGQQQSELTKKTQELDAKEKDIKMLLEKHKELQSQLEGQRRTVGQQQSELTKRIQEIDSKDKDIKKLQEQCKELQGQLEGQRTTVGQQQSELTKRAQEIEAEKNEVKNILGKQKQLQEKLDMERRIVELLQSEAAPTKPLSFDSKPRGSFKGPGSCWDVAVTPQGRLLVAAKADGLKEYAATSFQEIATWKPDSDLLGQEKSSYVATVDVLSDGRAVVGLNPKLVVLLRRGSSAAETWRVERRVADLQTQPRRLSVWCDRLLAVLEDRLDEGKNLWLPGPGLVLLSLCHDGSDKQLHRQQLDYNALSVALTYRCVIVSSEDQVEITEASGGGGGSRKCYVLDCYSHLGDRLWRHEVGGGHKVMSICTDTVGRVLYAAK